MRRGAAGVGAFPTRADHTHPDRARVRETTMKIRRLVIAGLFAAGVVAVPTTAAFASNGQGPGACVPPGSVMSLIAKIPDISTAKAWQVFAGEKSPGHVVSSQCTPAATH